MLDCFPKWPLLSLKKKIKLSYMILHNFLYNFVNCLVLIDIKQTLHYKVALV